MNFLQRLNKAPAWAKVVGVVVFGFILAPMAIVALKGMLALAVAIAIAVVGIFGFPVLVEAGKITKTKTMKGLWASNPIETLQIQYTEKVEKLSESQEALKVFIGKVNSFHSRLTAYKQQFPKNTEKHKLYQEQYTKFFDLQQLKESKYKNAMKAVENFGQTVQEAEAEWDMAKAAQDVNLASDFNNDPMELLKARTALTSVQDAMNTSFAELDIALLEEPKFEQESNVIDITPQTLRIPETIKVTTK